MVQTLEDWLHGAAQIVEVLHPAKVTVDRAFHMDGHSVRVTVQPGALVSGGHMREAVRGLERELLEDLHERSTVLLGIGDQAA